MIFTDSKKADKALTNAKIWDTISIISLPADASIIKKSEKLFELKLFDKTYEYSKEEMPQIWASIEYISSLGLGFLLQDMKAVEKLFNENSVKSQTWKEWFTFNFADKNGFSREEKMIFLKTLWGVLFGKERTEKANSPESLELLFKEARNSNKINWLAREKKIMDMGGDFKLMSFEKLIKNV
jgi:hypothetical protein